MVTGAVPQDRKIAHCPFHTLMPAERETFVARKRLLEYMGFQLRRAVMAKESQWDPKLLYLSKRGGWPWVQPRPCFSCQLWDGRGWARKGHERDVSCWCQGFNREEDNSLFNTVLGQLVIQKRENDI